MNEQSVKKAGSSQNGVTCLFSRDLPVCIDRGNPTAAAFPANPFSVGSDTGSDYRSMDVR